MNRHRRRRPRKQPIDQLERRLLFAAATININPAITYQTIEGLGAGMITYKLPSEYTDPNFFNTIVGDLGASAVRTEISPVAEKTNDNADPTNLNLAAFDTNALADSFDFLQQMQQRGVNTFVGSVWTAPAWMKTNGVYTNGGALKPDDYPEYAEYLSAVSQIAKNDFGVNLTALSLQNEPYFVEPYESTTYNANQLRETLRAVMERFQKDNVSTQILLPEDLNLESRVGWYVQSIMNDPQTKNFVGGFAGHGLSGHWDAIRDTLAPYGREYWMTETSGNSPTWPGAMGVASTIMASIGTADASSYIYWQFSDSAANASDALMINGQPTTKYYAARQFYRYIRPGDVHVDASSSDPNVSVVSFRNPTTGAMTTVLVNAASDSDDLTLNFAGSGLPGSYKVFRSSATENMVSLGSIAGGSTVTLSIPGMSIVTLTSAPELAAVSGGALAPNTPIESESDYLTQNNFFFNAFRGFNDSLTIQLNNGTHDVNQVASNGWTPLIAAASSPDGGSINTLQNLLAHGANINSTTPDGWTALHAAAANTFIKYGAPLDLVNQKINALLAGGADINARDNLGRTPLMWAAMMGAVSGIDEDPSIVQNLINQGANPNLTDSFGKTALDYAQQEGYVHISDALIVAMGIDHTPPTATVTPVSPDPRSVSVTDLYFSFSERIEGFDLSDLTLTRDGNVLPLNKDGYILSSDDEQNYHLSGIGGLTAAPGAYVITIVAAGSGIIDPSGNALAGNASDAWTMTKATTPPPPPTGTQSPYLGAPFAIGSGTTTIQVEDFDNGGEGVAYHDTDNVNKGGVFRTTEGVDIQPTTDFGGGYDVGYTAAGEWLEYTVNVASPGNYTFGARVASSGAGGTFHLEVDGANVSGAISIPNTNGWQTSTTVNAAVSLPAGQHVLRLALDSVGPTHAVGNFNYLTFAPSLTPPPPPPPTGSTPHLGTPFNITTSAPTTIQFEDFDNGGEGIAYHDVDKANLGGSYRTNEGVDIQPTTDAGGGYNVGYVKAGEWLIYTINVQAAGSYDLGFRVASTGSNGTFHAEIDGANVTGAMTVPNTGGFQTWRTITKTGVNLSAGQHILRIAFDAAGTNGSVGNFNYMTVSPTSTNPPPPPTTDQTPFLGSPFNITTSTATTIQFEDFDNGGEGVAYHDVDKANLGGSYRTSEGVDIQPTSDTGGGYNVGYVKPGEWLEYTANVATAGNYDFAFRVAAPAGGGTFDAEIDGANVTGAMTIPNTGGWQNWQTITKSNVALSAGQHIIRVAFDAANSTGSVGNFDYFTIKPSTLPLPPTTQTPFLGSPFEIGSAPITIQAEDFDNGGEGVAYHDSDSINSGGANYRPGTGVDIEATGDTGGGYHVGYTLAGEWLEYTVHVDQTGIYNLDFRVASKGAGGNFNADIDGADITGQLAVPDTTGWNTFSDVSKNNVALSAGDHVLRLAFDSVGGTTFTGNFNWIKITQASTSSTTLASTASAYVRGGTYAKQNFGSDPALIVKKHSDPTSSRESFITFDLGSISTINSATLRLFGSLNDTSSTSVQTQVFGADGAVWNENTLTWNTRPATTTAALATAIVTGTTQQWYSFDVTSFLKNEKAAGRSNITFVLRNPTQQNALVVFNSDDAATNQPQLVVA